MPVRLLIDAIESDSLPGTPLGERLVHLEICHLADRKGTVRLSQSELAGKLGVTRQAVTKHTDALIAKRLLMRQGHGRYRVFVEPWSVEAIARQYAASLPPGAEFDVERLAVLAYGEANDLDWDGNDPRVVELDATAYRLKHAGLLIEDEDGFKRPRAAARR